MMTIGYCPTRSCWMLILPDTVLPDDIPSLVFSEFQCLFCRYPGTEWFCCNFLWLHHVISCPIQRHNLLVYISRPIVWTHMHGYFFSAKLSSSKVFLAFGVATLGRHIRYKSNCRSLTVSSPSNQATFEMSVVFVDRNGNSAASSSHATVQGTCDSPGGAEEENHLCGTPWG